MTHEITHFGRLGLGTAQFGLDYGISNKLGRTAESETEKILAIAAEYGMGYIDTAPVYGSSEEILGRLLPRDHQFKIITKTVLFEGEVIAAGAGDKLVNGFEESLEKLRAQSVYGLMLHHVDDLLRPGGEILLDTLLKLKERNLVQKVGVSVYTGDQIDAVLNKFKIDIIQLPINVFDQRLLRGSQIARLKKAGVEIHARSVFLQGLLLMEPQAIPEHIAFARPVVESYRKKCRKSGSDPMSMALSFVRKARELDNIVLGVNDSDQLRANLKAWEDKIDYDFQSLAVDDERIITPRIWSMRSCTS